jgi:hypothetical protein
MMRRKEVKNVANEKILLVYFEHLLKYFKSSSLESNYKIIIDTGKDSHLIAFLKKTVKGYRLKKLV